MESIPGLGVDGQGHEDGAVAKSATLNMGDVTEKSTNDEKGTGSRHGNENENEDGVGRKKKERVAVIGSGMAGLVTAHLLQRDKRGRFDVEVLEMVCSFLSFWGL